MSEKPDDLLTPDEVCQKLGITQKTLCEWNIKHRHRAILAPIRFSAKVVRYERRNVDAFIQNVAASINLAAVAMPPAQVCSAREPRKLRASTQSLPVKSHQKSRNVLPSGHLTCWSGEGKGG